MGKSSKITGNKTRKSVYYLFFTCVITCNENH